MTHLLALTGYARSGKDTLAKPLIESGWSLYNFGHVIKLFFADYLGDPTATLDELLEKMSAANPLLTQEQLDRFALEVITPLGKNLYALGEFEVDAFTEDNEIKRVIRPILEHGGDLIYDYVMTTYFAEIDRRLTAGERIVNTRLVRIPEGMEWALRGGRILEIDRKDWPAASEWEANALVSLRKSGLIDNTLLNHGTAGDWDAYALEFANDLNGNNEGRAVA